jgi:catechol 2,3-dioxygenase-like lactoylglutathione lyase family enzyme
MFETTQASVDIGLTTRNIEAMRAFYIGVLGLEEVAVREIPGDFITQAGFGTGDLRLHALKFGDILIKLLEWKDAPPATDPLADKLAGFRYLTFWVKDMEAAVDHLKAAGVELVSDILARVPERKLVFFKDPDGNLIELNWIDPAAA